MMGPIDGLRVLDCSHGTSGPRLTGMLADYGADVVWVEPPGGDPIRRRMPGAASVFNRGKRSLVLDLHDQRQRDHLLRLVERADVFVESWRPGVANRLRVDYPTLAAMNPRLVYASISGFGQDGRHRDLPGYEAIVQALVGTMADQAGIRPGPIYPGLAFAAIGAAYLGALGILAALYRRGVDGKGRYVDTSLFDGALAYRSLVLGESDSSVAALRALGVDRAPTTEGTRIVTRSFECADGEYVGIHTGAVGAFGRLMEILGLGDRIPPSESGLDLGAPLEPDQEVILTREMPKIIAMKPRSYWVERLIKADICVVEHLYPTDAYDTPQVRHNQMTIDITDPALGRVTQVAPAVKFASAPSPTIDPAPMVGQDTDEVLGSLAGWPEPPESVAHHTTEAVGLLDGVRIVDFGAYFAGPYSSRLLADLGADVIKLEPVVGDPMRGFATTFNDAQAGKRSLAADLKDPQLKLAVHRLVEWADVVHHNLRPGAAERLGMDYETVSKISADTVYLHAPGWGADGPCSRRQSFAPMLSGYVGVTFEVAGRFNPPLPPLAHEDPGNGLLGAVAILLGLLQRQRSGSGCCMVNPQLNATLAHTAHIVRTEGGEVIGAGLLDPLQFGLDPFERVFETADGWICLSATDGDGPSSFCRILGVAPDDDDRVMTNLLVQTVARRDTASLLQECAEAGVTAVEPVGPNIHALLNDPEQRRLGRVVEYPHPTLGHVREVGVLLRVSDGGVPRHRPAPVRGQHSDEILGWLGYDGEEIAVLRSRRVVS